MTATASVAVITMAGARAMPRGAAPQHEQARHQRVLQQAAGVVAQQAVPGAMEIADRRPPGRRWPVPCTAWPG